MTTSESVGGRLSIGSDAASGLARILAVGFGTALIATYQTGFLPYFEPLVRGLHGLWFLIYGCLWLCCLVLAGFIVATDDAVRRRLAPIALTTAVTLGFCLLHPFDMEVRDLARTVLLFACLTTFCMAGGARLMLRVSASVTALEAVICLFDIAFRDGFTNTVGRAAGLGINPNITAANLVLGAVAAYRVLPPRLCVPFLLLVGAALFCTLSRSTLLIAAVIVLLAGGVGLWRRARRWRAPDWRQYAAKLLVGLLLGVIVLGAASLNVRFRESMALSYEGLLGAAADFQTASDRIGISPPFSAATEASAAAGTATIPAAVATERSTTDAISALGHAAETEGRINSISARVLMMQRSLLALASGAPLGEGLDTAFQLSPHNTYLMFAVAFGLAGLLVPIGFLLPAFYRIRAPEDLALGLAMAGLLLFSHNILLSPGPLVPYAVGVGGLLASGLDRGPAPGARRAIRAVAIATFALVAIGCGVVGTIGAGLVRLDPLAMAPVGGHAFTAPLFPDYSGLIHPADVPASGGSIDLREDGVPISQSPASLAEIRSLGAGRAQRFPRDVAIFSTPDNSDPRQNGRSYEASVPLTVHPLMFLVLAATLLWCVVLVAMAGRPSSPDG